MPEAVSNNQPPQIPIPAEPAHNLLKQDKKTKAGIKAKRKKAGWNDGCLLEVLGVQVD